MTLLDANLLLYAYSSDDPQHQAAAHWVTDLLDSNEVIALPWITIWAFIRISTNPRILPNPIPAAKVLAIIKEWLSFPDVVVVEPGPRHFELLQKLVLAHNATGPLVTHATLAALAIEHGATLASTDQDFARFRDLRWLNPLAQSFAPAKR